MILSTWLVHQRRAGSQNTHTTSSTRFLTHCFSSLSLFVTRSHTDTLKGKSPLCQLLDTFPTSGTGTLHFHGDTEPNNLLCMKEVEGKSWHTHHHSYNTPTFASEVVSVSHTHMPTHNNTHRDTFLIASNSQHVHASLVSCCLRGV